MNLDFSDYFVVCLALAIAFYSFLKFKQNSNKLIFRDVIITSGYVTYTIYHIADSYDDGRALAFLVSAGLSFMAAGVGLAITEIVISMLVRIGRAPDLKALVDKSVRWIVIALIVMYMINIVHDGFMRDQGARIDLLCADTVGLCLALLCLERTRRQMSVTVLATTADYP